MRAQTRRTNVWLAGFRVGRHYWWAERAGVLAAQGVTGVWGHPPEAWRRAVPPVPSLRGNGGSCHICFEDFSSPAPTHALDSRAPEDVFDCDRRGDHAICVGCMTRLFAHARARNGRPSCCVCRQPCARDMRPMP